MEAGYSHLFSGLGWNKYNQQTDKTDRPKDRQTVGGGMHACMYGEVRLNQNAHAEYSPLFLSSKKHHFDQCLIVRDLIN